MRIFPKATYPLEYIALFTFVVPTGEGDGHIFLAVDAMSEFAFNLGVERDNRPETVLKKIYYLLENEDFLARREDGRSFTLVLADFRPLAARIEAIIRPEGGTLLFDREFNEHLATPVLESFTNFFSRKR